MRRRPRISTGGGDDGTTLHPDMKRRVSKAHPDIALVGLLDELGSALGLARSLLRPEAEELDSELLTLQQWLLNVPPLLFSPPPSQRGSTAPSLAEMTQRVEAWALALEERLPRLEHFTVSGETAGSAALHVARCVARRAETEVVRLHGASPPWRDLVRFLNRLADLLFLSARWEPLAGKGPGRSNRTAARS